MGENKNKRALVTGGLGFIGSNLVLELINSGYKVEIVDDMSNGHPEFLIGKPIRMVPADLLSQYDKESEQLHAVDGVPRLLVITSDFADDAIFSRILANRYDVIFHLAANPRVEYSVNNPTETTETNVLKTVGLFEVAAKSGTRVVFSSSASVYGDAIELPTPEKSLKAQNSPYGLQKYVGELYAGLMAKLHGLDVVCLRYFNVYGPRQWGDSPYATAVCAWCDKVKREQALRSDGDGTQTRDLVYVADVARANIAAAEYDGQWHGEALNVAYGQSYSNLEILNMFKNKFSNLPIKSAPWRAGDVMHTLADVTLISDVLGFNAQVGLEEGLKKTWEWWGF